jgi:hypothetical protein
VSARPRGDQLGVLDPSGGWHTWCYPDDAEDLVRVAQYLLSVDFARSHARTGTVIGVT